MGDLKFTMLGNTATHKPQGLGGLPGMTGGDVEAEEVLADLDVPEVPGSSSSRSAASAGTSGPAACPLNMNKLTMEDLYDEVEDIISATGLQSRRPRAHSSCSSSQLHMGSLPPWPFRHPVGPMTGWC